MNLMVNDNGTAIERSVLSQWIRQTTVIKKKDLLKMVEETCAKRNHTLKSNPADLNFRTNQITIFCNTHSKSSIKRAGSYLDQPWGMTCCAGSRDFQNRKDKAENKVLELAKERNHSIKNFEFKNVRNCTFDLFCEQHGQLFENICYDNYTDNRVKWSVPCCASSCRMENSNPSTQILRTHRNKEAVFRRKADQGECAVTGITKEEGNLQIHHLYGSAQYPQLKFVFDNSIMLHESVHRLFHNTWSDATPKNFLNFLKQLATEGGAQQPKDVKFSFDLIKEQKIAQLIKEISKKNKILDRYLKDPQIIPLNEKNPSLNAGFEDITALKKQGQQVQKQMFSLDDRFADKKGAEFRDNILHLLAQIQSLN